MEPDRIVIGASTDADGQAVADLYADLEAPVIRTDVASAEMIKYGSNAFLATKISFINEIANVCEEVGADVSWWRREWGSTTASARTSCGRALDLVELVSPRT